MNGKKRSKPLQSGLMLVGALSGLLLLAFLWQRGGLPCLFKAVTGLPCLSCGISRALTSAVQGRMAASFRWHPLWPLVPLLLLGYIAQRNDRFPRLARLYRRRQTWVLLLVLLLLCYGLRLYFLFPDNPPMDFDSRALLPRLWRVLLGA